MTPRPEDRILTIPNLVTFVRLIGVGVFWWLLLGLGNVAASAWLVFGVGWTDWVDGYLARRLGQVSRLGTAIDPVADRLMIVSAVVGGMIADVVPSWVAVPLLAREATMGVVALILAARGLGTLEVRYAGKLATFLLYGAIPAFYLAAAGVLPAVMLPLAWTTGVIGLAIYWYVAFLYIGDAGRRFSRLESAAADEGT